MIFQMLLPKMSRKFSRQFNAPLGFPDFFASKIFIKNEQPPDTFLEEDVVEIMAEVTHSFAERYDMKFERLGDVK